MYGKSDKVNAVENDNPDFKSGYDCAMGTPGTLDAIGDEWEQRGRPEEGDALAKFREWKRGFWAAKMQRSYHRI